MLRDFEIQDDVPSDDDLNGDANVRFHEIQDELSRDPAYGAWLDSIGHGPGQVDDEEDAHMDSECRRDLHRREIFRRNIEALTRISRPTRPAA